MTQTNTRDLMNGLHSLGMARVQHHRGTQRKAGTQGRPGLSADCEVYNLLSMKEKLFQITTGVAAAYHLVLGLALLILPAGAMGGMIRVFLGTELKIDPQLSMIGKFAAAYILAFGVMLALLCVNPLRLRALVVPALVLFGIRVANKLVFLTTIEENFGVLRGRSLFALASLAVIFGIMAWARPAGDEPRAS